MGMRNRLKAVWVALAVVGLTIFAILAVVAIQHGNERTKIATRNQTAISQQLSGQAVQLATLQNEILNLEDENKSLSKTAADAQTQANTSVGQLTATGQKPIISAPGVVTVSTTPSTTTTLPPVVVTIPVPAPTNGTPDTTTTQPPDTTTMQPPDTTTTTEPSTTTTTSPPDTTTTQPPDTTTTSVPDTTTTLRP